MCLLTAERHNLSRVTGSLIQPSFISSDIYQRYNPLTYRPFTHLKIHLFLPSAASYATHTTRPPNRASETLQACHEEQSRSTSNRAPPIAHYHDLELCALLRLASCTYQSAILDSVGLSPGTPFYGGPLEERVMEPSGHGSTSWDPAYVAAGIG